MIKKLTNLLTKSLFIFLLCSTIGYTQTIRYVKPIATGTGNGNSWENASSDIQAMINISIYGDEIWVAGGIYKPIRKAHDLEVITPNDIENAFVLKDGVKIYGSFLGNEASLNQRTLPSFNGEINYPSILSGDFSNDDIITLEGEFISVINNTENARHIIIASGNEESPISSATLIDGFTITGAYAEYIPSSTFLVNGQYIQMGSGAGIYNIKSSAQYYNLAVTLNMAQQSGGGIYNELSSIVMVNTVVSNNIANQSSGGAIYNQNSSLNITDAIIDSNRSLYHIGGGISHVLYNYDPLIPSAPSELTINNTTINNNYAAGGGGGIINSSSLMTLNNVTISNNKTLGSGGGINNSGDASLTNVTITSNSAKNDGGGVLNFMCTLTLNNVIINENIAQSGRAGGIFNTTNSTVQNYTISSIIANETSVNNNQGYGTVGGIYIDMYCTINFTDGSINGNSTVLGGATGGLYNSTLCSAFLTDVEISGNQGSGIYNGSGSISNYTNLTISNNITTGIGGGVCSSHCSPVFKNVIFDGNKARLGGAIFNGIGSSNYNDIIITNNTATEKGGGIYNAGGSSNGVVNTSFYSNVIMTGNTAVSDGGGMYNDEHVSAVINNCEIKGNTGSRGGGVFNKLSVPLFTNVLISGNKVTLRGGGILNEGSSPILTNVTIVGNNAPNNQGGGMYNTHGGVGSNYSNSYPVLRNSIVWGNSALNIYSSNNSTVTCHHSLVQGLTTDDSNGNISGTVNPLFTESIINTTAPTTVGNYSLQNNSPMINVGNNLYFLEGQTPNLSAITIDLAGNPRVQETTIDLGAYENTICNTQAPELSSQNFCSAVTVADLANLGMELQWYTSLTSEVPLQSETQLSSGTYFVSIIIGNCESERTEVEISINDIQPPSGNTEQIINLMLGENATLNNLEVIGSNIKWYASENEIMNNNPLPVNTVLTNNSTYYVTQTINGCESSPLAITVTVVLSINDFKAQKLHYYPNPVIETLTIENDTIIESIIVYNLVGQEILFKEVNLNNYNLDLSYLQQGSYIINIQSKYGNTNFVISKT